MIDRPTYPDCDPDDDGDLDDDDASRATGPPTIADVIVRWRYTLAPTLYVDEDSDVGSLIWQSVLEQRAVRAWLVVGCALLGLLLVVGTTFTLVLAAAP